MLFSEPLRDLGFAHGFSTRLGGVSEAPYQSLNLAFNVGDRREAVLENRERFFADLGTSSADVAEVSQVHGASVVEVRERGELPSLREREADALFTSLPGLALGVRSADCVPLLVADPQTGRVAAIHAGWRGVVAGVIAQALMLLRQAGSHLDALHIVICPHIRAAAFEVGKDVADALGAILPEAIESKSGGKFRADLTQIVRAQLAQSGIAREQIADLGGCTFGDAERFYSYRREGARSGRHLAIIVAP